MKLEERISRSVSKRPGTVVLRAELSSLGSASQLSRALEGLVAKGRLVRVGKGVFAKARLNRFTGEPAPSATLEAISSELFEKLRVSVKPGKLAQEYNSGVSTQLPMQVAVNTGKRRISRRITVGGRTLAYENDFRGA